MLPLVADQLTYNLFIFYPASSYFSKLLKAKTPSPMKKNVDYEMGKFNSQFLNIYKYAINVLS